MVKGYDPKIGYYISKRGPKFVYLWFIYLLAPGLALV